MIPHPSPSDSRFDKFYIRGVRPCSRSVRVKVSYQHRSQERLKTSRYNLTINRRDPDFIYRRRVN